MDGVDKLLRRYPESPIVADVLGTLNPAEIRARVHELEPLLVGNAAGSFTYTEELSYDVFVWPAAQESLAFIDEYESARGRPFTAGERRSAHGACVYLRGYAARCGHAVGADRGDSGLESFAEELL